MTARPDTATEDRTDGKADTRRGSGSLKDAMDRSERLREGTGFYKGIEHLTRRDQDPLRYESFHAKLRAAVVGARETSKKISASPGVREVGESVVALYTAEGDSIALSTGIMIHVHTMSRFIKWMISNGYEEDPGIRPGDIFANNDPFIADLHQPDLMIIIPLFHGEELIGWAGSVCHEIEIGGVVGGANMGVTAERFGNGLTVTAEKIGSNDVIDRDYFVRAEYNLRTPIYWILDSKAMVSADQDVRETVGELIEEYGLDYYREATAELIEEGRRGHLERVRLMTVPGRYRAPVFSCHLIENTPGVSPMCEDLMVQVPLEMRVGADGMIDISVEGTSPQSWTPYNMAPAAFDGLFFVCLTQFLDYDGRVNDGAYYGLNIEVPKGSWANPDSHLVSIGSGWALIMATFNAWQRAMSRAFLARGFKEEVFLGGATTPLVEGGGINQYGQIFGAQLLDGAAQGSGARGIMDGIDCGYVIWNPEADMGNMEIWESILPILTMGRRMVSDHYGWGKYRGGRTFSDIFKVHRSDRFAFQKTLTSDQVFDQAGMCGGYPAPVDYSNVVKGADIAERAAAGKPLPHVEGDPANPELKRLLSGEFETRQEWFYDSLKEGDVYQMFYHTAGGYGDPLERDPALVKQDLDDGTLSLPLAKRVYHVAAKSSGSREPHEILPEETASLREGARNQRKERAVPFAEWHAKTREAISRHDLDPLVLKMFRDSFGLSNGWRDEFIEFWGLEPNFTID